MSGMRLREAVMEDARAVLDWRNEPETRKHFFDCDPVSWEEHQRWFAGVLQAESRFLLIAEDARGAVGVLRFDQEGTRALVSIFLVPGRAGKGLGAELLRAGARWVKGNLDGVAEIEAHIKRDNVASMRAFQEAGYAESHLVYTLPLK